MAHVVLVYYRGFSFNSKPIARKVYERFIGGWVFFFCCLPGVTRYVREPMGVPLMLV